jgi:hypothetical protein
VICSFCPRKLDFDPLAVPIPTTTRGDTFHPLKLSKFAKELDDGKYAYSWYENAPDVAGAEAEAAVDGDATGAGLTSHF